MKKIFTLLLIVFCHSIFSQDCDILKTNITDAKEFKVLIGTILNHRFIIKDTSLTIIFTKLSYHNFTNTYGSNKEIAHLSGKIYVDHELKNDFEDAYCSPKTHLSDSERFENEFISREKLSHDIYLDLLVPNIPKLLEIIKENMNIIENHLFTINTMSIDVKNHKILILIV